jgi:hypothetical protein
MPSGVLEQPIPPVADYNPALAVPSTVTSTGYQSTPYTANTYQATPYAVPEQGMVQKQVLDIVGKDSPLMQQARTKANQVMNARGLLNSTLNTQAGQEAVISQALPIATSDAGAINAAMTNTANAKNTASQFNTGQENVALTNTANQANAASQFGAAAANSASQANAQIISNMNLANAGAQNTAMAQEAQAANTRALALIDNNTKMQLANLDVQSRQLLQSSTAASQAYVQAVSNIAAISQSNTMNQAAKDAAITTQMNLLRQQLSTIGGIASTQAAAVTNLNLGQYFQTTNSDGGAVVPGTPGSSPFNGSIPAGGWRDAQGNVFNANGTPAGWQGPPGMPSGALPPGSATGGGASGGSSAVPTSPKPTRAVMKSDWDSFNKGKHNLWVWTSSGWKWQA